MGNDVVIRKERCPLCAAEGHDKSGDNLNVYSNGIAHCFRCDKSMPVGEPSGDVTPPTPGEHKWITGSYAGLPSRCLSEKTLRFFRYQFGERYGKKCHIANFMSPVGDIVGQKYRFPGKNFNIEGQVDLFGKHLWGKSKKIVITEGEIDAMSVAEVQDCKWPVVSVPNGAGGARKVLARNIEWLEENFDQIILMFDMDEVGQKAARECAELFTPGRVAIARLPHKDANECLVKGQGGEIVRAIWNAPTFRPDGIVNALDILEEVCSSYRPEDAMYPWMGLNLKTKGLRRGEIVTFCAGTGIGKSQILREIAYHLLNMDDSGNIGYIALEESIKRTAFGLMSVATNRLLHLEYDVSKEELADIHKKVFGSGRVFLYDHWGSLESEGLLNKIRYLANGCDVRWIILDHLSIVVSGLEGGDERRIIDYLMTQLRKITEELNIGLLLVSHLKRPDGKPHEEGATTSLGQLRGSASIGQLSDVVIGVERNQQDNERRHLSQLRVLKNRFTGDTGPAGVLSYDPGTGRLHEYTGELDNGDDGEGALGGNSQVNWQQWK